MATTVFRMDLSTSIREAAHIMADMELGSILVTRDNQIEGIVTESDMVRKVLGRDVDPDLGQVGQIMSSPLLTVDGATTLEEARGRMDREGIRHLMVTIDGEIRGVVSIRDLIHTPRLS